MVDDFETAEQFGKTRALVAPFIGALILALQQGVVFVWDWGLDVVGSAASSRRLAVLRRNDAAASPLWWRLVIT